MSDITLSKAVRSNLLNLQSTAAQLGKTQERLATGLRVNSALDNPTNFFTASSLNSRASDMSQLLDSMSNGIQTIEAADNGLSAITKTLESMQSTLTQARQDKSFKATSYTIDLGATPSGSQQISFSGGSVGDTAINIGLATNTGGTTGSPTNAAVVGTSAIPALTGAANATTAATGTAITSVTASTNATAAGTSWSNVDASGGDITFQVNGQTVTLAQAGGAAGIYDLSAVVSAINTQVGTSAGVTAADDGSGNLQLTSTGTTGSADTLTVDTFSGGDATQLGFAGASVSTTGSDASGGIDASGGDITFQINGQTVTLGSTGGDGGHFDLAAVVSAINTQVGTSASVTAADDGSGNLQLTSTGTAGGSDAITVDTFSSGDATQLGFSTAAVSVTGTAATGGGIDASGGDITFDINGSTVTLASTGGDGGRYDAASIASAINSQVGTSASVNATQAAGVLTITSTGTAGTSDTVTVDNFSAGVDATDLGFASATATDTGEAAAITGGTWSAKSVDQLVEAINTDSSLKGNIRASNDNGKLRIENLSTQDLTVTGWNSTSANIDGGAGTTTIGGNTVRADLATQYNTLRDQLDKLSDDASFNGVNLLRGDKLQITFNETSTSEISIQAKGGKSVNSANLGLQTSLQSEDLDSDTNIDGYIGLVKNALGSVRSQASSFGSNLSVVQNRQDFTKNMINTLQTGASNLTLADSNEEAANLLALQTRQQLSSTALSLASQSDQNVLRLF